ncbi:restriction endonuclease [Aquitalea magnusonii]|uniref:restriction endonuclease n=1 Tax=Aquitalea magnusonii TaxID=332411 RepID=UPI00128F2DE1|nr:restriction endonuclease [Aquitalea magnusonii]
MGVARRKPKQSFAQGLIASPWYVSVGFAVASLILFKQILPAMWAGNMFLKPLSQAFAAMAWLPAGFFFLLAALAALREFGQRPPANKRVIPPLTPATPRPSAPPPRDVVADAYVPPPTITKPTPPSKPQAWSLALIHSLEWKRFEDVCQQFYQLHGIKSETTPLGPDGGIDIRLYQDDSGKATSIVQCKAWGERYVGVKPVRELLGVMTHEKIPKAFFMTSGKFSDDAKLVASSNHISLIDGAMMLTMIERLPVDAKQQLLEFATRGDYTTPTCPHCGIPMRHVAGKGGRPDFWGCHNYPRCKQTLGMRGG